jgi:hypothetical protein
MFCPVFMIHASIDGQARGMARGSAETPLRPELQIQPDLGKVFFQD